MRVWPHARGGARRAAGALAAAATALLASWAEADERSLMVTATAYNSLPEQTHGDPTLAAWGDVLEPGMRAIAVSRDLIALGLRHGTRVRIEGLPGVWVVRDKMARRWRRKIDVYMGEDVEAARRFGRRKLLIRWTPAGAEEERGG